MDTQKVDMYIMANQKYFPAEKMIFIRERLLSMDDAKFPISEEHKYELHSPVRIR